MTIKFKEDGSIDLYAEDSESTPDPNAENPTANSVGNGQNSNAPDGGSIYLWNPNALNTQGLFPKRFPSSVSGYQALVNLIRDNMSYQEKLLFKRKMWAAGFYAAGEPGSNAPDVEGGQSGYDFGSQLNGRWNDVDEAALKNLFDSYKNENQATGRTGAAIDLDSVFSDRLLEQAGETRENLIANYDLQGISIALQEYASKNLGREYTEEQIQKILQDTFAFDQEPGEVSSTTQWSAQNTQTDPMTKKQLVIGGGPDSSAINFGRGLAATYNLVVDTAYTERPRLIGATPEFEEAFAEGRAVKITGDRQRMIKLHEWANTQKREDGVFENVRFVYENNSNEPTAILISMREGAQVPPMGIAGFSFGQIGDDIDKFLDSVKRPGDVYAYSWEGEGPGRRGAYGMSDQIWEFYTNQLGIDSGDTSITAQDRVARAYVSDLWNRYNNWTEVALALRVNEDTANRRIAERQTQGSGYVDVVTDPAELQWANQAVAKMGEWKPVLDSSKATDLYSSMYGENTNYIPLNLYAGPPSNDVEAKRKALYLAAKSSAPEIAAGSVLENVMKKASSRSVVPYTGERKWS